jgi:hypothetical protein
MQKLGMQKMRNREMPKREKQGNGKEMKSVGELGDLGLGGWFSYRKNYSNVVGLIFEKN